MAHLIPPPPVSPQAHRVNLVVAKNHGPTNLCCCCPHSPSELAESPACLPNTSAARPKHRCHVDELLLASRFLVPACWHGPACSALRIACHTCPPSAVGRPGGMGIEGNGGRGRALPCDGYPRHAHPLCRPQRGATASLQSRAGECALGALLSCTVGMRVAQPSAGTQTPAKPPAKPGRPATRRLPRLINKTTAAATAGDWNSRIRDSPGQRPRGRLIHSWAAPVAASFSVTRI